MNFTFQSKKLLWALVAIGFMMLNSCNPDNDDDFNVADKYASTYSAKVPLEWNKLMLDIDRYAPGYRPPAAARMMAYTQLAAYEAIVPGMPNNNSLAKHFTALSLPAVETGKEYSWPLAANAAYATSYKLFYPHVNLSYFDKMNVLEKAITTEFSAKVSSEVSTRSIAFGKAVAEAVYEWSKTDAAGHEAFKNPRPSTYTPPTTGAKGEKLWQPTFPDYTPALFPYWGKVRTFALKESEKTAKPPIAWSEDPNSKFYTQAKEVKLWVDNATDEDKWIAEYWSDDIFELTFEPAARLISIANQMVEEEQMKLDEAVELYAKMGMALSDVAVAVWNSKYTYNVERPISYIRRVMDPNWKTLLNNPLKSVSGMTPEFPAYPSGHSGFGGAGAAILTHAFGTHEMTDDSHKGRTEFVSKARTYTNFAELGVEDAYSRLPLGVHFRMDCDEGLRLGYLAALRVTQLPWKK
ncbi:phosphatase PAP2 family protein [Haliscomenobacter sp.]|uniref:vanadium-dependent haloperoxidase n=1 Tax=Haliscomenobacter sp. TaxID=2717303 RepID=UPI003BAC5EB7